MRAGGGGGGRGVHMISTEQWCVWGKGGGCTCQRSNGMCGGRGGAHDVNRAMACVGEGGVHMMSTEQWHV